MYNTEEGWHAVHHFCLATREAGSRTTIAITRGAPPGELKRPLLQQCPERRKDTLAQQGTEKPLRTNSSATLLPPPSPLKRYRQGAYGSQPFTYVQLATKLNRFLRKQKCGKKGRGGGQALFIYLFPFALFFLAFLLFLTKGHCTRATNIHTKT